MVWNVKQNIQAWKIYFVKIEILKFQTNLKKLQNRRCFLSFLTRNDLLPRGGGHLGIFGVGMCRPELQIGNPF